MHDLILLAALREGPKHGWALKKLAGFLSGSGEMHNNLVYPLMKKFVREGWVRRRAEPGERGQTRSVYSLTRRGNQQLMRRLDAFGEKEASSAPEFRLRVGLFALVDANTRSRMLALRDAWLASRENHFAAVRAGLGAMNATEWGRQVVEFLLQEVRQERRWIKSLDRRSVAPSSRRSSWR
jgi:DNA-binding PadR family transcriptional regulator